MNKAYQEVLSEIKRRKDKGVYIGLFGYQSWYYENNFDIVMSMSDCEEPSCPGELAFVCCTSNGIVV